MTKEVTLRPYQIEDVSFMTKRRRVLNANEPGLGKTLETLTALKELDAKKTLIISPKMAAGVWQFEAAQWYGWDSIKITGEKNLKQRKELRRQFDESNVQFLMINFDMVAEIQEWRNTWHSIVIDEAHLGGLLNPKSKTFKLIQKFQCDNLFILTGTPIRKGPHDLWPMLHLLNPDKFKAYWPFVNKYCQVIDNGFGKEILGRPKDPTRFKAMLDCYVIRRKKTDVLKDLPDKVRQVVPIDMEGRQLQKYNELLEEMIMEIEETDDVLITPSRMTQDLRLRQLLVCPRLLGLDDDGAAIRTLCEYLIPEEFAQGRSVAIATPFRQAIPFLTDALLKALPGVKLEFIHGQIKETAQEVAQRFQNIKTHKKIIIYTIKSGASWTATDASTGFFLGYEWDCNDQIQAEDRIHRIGQKNNVFWKYLLHNGTVDEAVMSKINQKFMAAGWILSPQEMYERMQELRRKNLRGY